jgi:flagellar M-ring protein FliF
VTVASNLPDGDAGAAGSNQSQTTEKQERVNYEVSETSRQIIKAPGSVRKVSVAVLVDQETVVAADGSVTFQPRSPEELATLTELVASAVGLDEARGDVLTLKSLPFQPIAVDGTLVEAGMFGSLGNLDVMSIIQLGVLSLVALILALFVIRPILTSGSSTAPQLDAPYAPLALPGGNDGTGALNGEIDDLAMMMMPATADFAEQEAAMNGTDTDPVARLRRLIEERQAESIEILRSWMEHDEEPA